jgi:translocation protein SEC62
VIQPSPVDSAKYASFKFDTTTSRKWMMVGLLLGVLLLVLFPVWPYMLKYVIWLISLYLLVALVGLLVFRFCVYVLCVAAGFDVWIFPNLLGDYGVIESFYPIIHAERW